MKAVRFRLSGVMLGMLCGVLPVVSAQAQSLTWIGTTYVVLSEDLGSRQWYDAGASSANPDFVNRMFTNRMGQTLHIGGQAQTYAPVYGTAVTMFWRIRKEVSAGSFVTISSGNFPLPYRNQQGNNDRWEQHPVPGQTPGSTTHNVNVLAGLPVGIYQFQVWYRAQVGSTTVWDTNGGINYSASLEVIADPDMPPPGVSYIIPEVPRDRDEVVIRYEAGDGPLSDAGEVILFIGRNGWLNPVQVPMVSLGNGVWESAFRIRRLTGSLQWAFHDNASADPQRWDNNWYANWKAVVLPVEDGAELDIVDPMWNVWLPNTLQSVDVHGVARGMDGDLHWINEATGDEGWIPAADEWTVEGMALAEGPNLLRVTGMSSVISPNAGAQDCATNTLYQNDGWQWRQNGGQGWGEWALNTSGSGGHFVGNAGNTTNLLSNASAWGLYSGSSGEAHAIRRLSTHLRVGEKISMKFENNAVQAGGSVGFTLRSGRDERLFSFYFQGGDAHYLINDSVTGFNTGIPWRDTGMELVFELTSPTNYRFTVAGVEFNRSLNNVSDPYVRMFRIWNVNAGSGGGYNLFCSDLKIVGVEMTPREWSVERVVERQPGLGSVVSLSPSQTQVDVMNTQPDYEYDVYTTGNLLNNAWVPLGQKVRGDLSTKSFVVPHSGAGTFVMAAGREIKNWLVDNPYADVRWGEYERHKAAMHLHTTMSDGGGSPAAVIDRYIELGYSIIALTDHDTMGPGANMSHPNRNRTTWPWEAFGRSPDALNVLAVEGNEISNLADFGSFFNDYGDGQVEDQEEALEQVAARGGLAVMFHPGRYLDGEGRSRDINWYVQLYRKYTHLVGLEVYNQIDRYPNDRAAWDAMLTQIIDERPIWGYSNDDMHSMSSQLGYNYNIMLMPELSEAWLRWAMITGSFFWVHSPHAHSGPPPPYIQSIAVNEADGIISINATGHRKTEWISEGLLVYEGDQIDLNTIAPLGKYVRAVVYGEGSNAILGTQPFRVRRNFPE